MKLVSFGDGLIAGDKAPKILADMLGFEFIDRAKEETSNQTIFRDVIDYITNNNDECFILIGWTLGNQREIRWNEKTFIYNENKIDYEDNLVNRLHKYDDVLFDRLLVAQHRASEAYTLQNVLKNKKIKYYMYNTQDCIFFHEKTLKYLKALNGRTYHNPLNKESSMKFFVEKQNDSDHHRVWAEFLHSKIEVPQ